MRYGHFSQEQILAMIVRKKFGLIYWSHLKRRSQAMIEVMEHNDYFWAIATKLEVSGGGYTRLEALRALKRSVRSTLAAIHHETTGGNANV